ncbi:hypothetical protein AXG93_3022s1030 [Marchantia polymorpha subsp. ruderalis]|uniref:Uncharacterized protein n=1 Tax=Marchantia polymorpha subsp. ruderalis TaxID=1480154 RepID=A0A176VDE1_MARPO|nr:hypothetical protein AXG93_3022s1030 [Marchantia polymorpha subsp. ruderalis]
MLGPCVGNKGDFMFEKDSVKITRAEDFTFVALFRNAQSGTNGWKIADYKDPMRRAIALEVMHILRPQRTTYVTAWQIGFFKRVVKGNRGMGLLTKEEEKRFSKEQEILAIKSNEETEDEDNGRTRVPSQTTARGPVQSRTRTRPKMKANRGVVVSDSLDSTVEKTDAATLATAKDKNNEPTLQVLEGGPSAVGRTVGAITDILATPPLEEEVRCEVAENTSEEIPKESDLRATFEQDCSSLRIVNENVPKITVELCERLEASKGAYVAEVQRVERLIVVVGKRDQLHPEELAKTEGQRAEEARIAEDLPGLLAAAKTGQEEL